MAEAGDDKSVEDMMAQVQLLELQAKRMEKLVNQRRQERADMEAENLRAERQLKYMRDMLKENEEVEEEYQKQQQAKAPFSGQGFTLGAPSAEKTETSVAREVSHARWTPVTVDPDKASGNIQVRLVSGGKMVVKLNTDHTVAHIKQEMMARDQEMTRRQFTLITLGPPSTELTDSAPVQPLIGSAVIQRYL